MLIRLLLGLCLTLAGATARAEQESDRQSVVARLLYLERAGFGCGVVAVGSVATYFVLNGPVNLTGREIKVIVRCIEMSEYSDWKKPRTFKRGQVHRLTITERNVHNLDTPELPVDPYWFYLDKAALKAP